MHLRTAYLQLCDILLQNTARTRSGALLTLSLRSAPNSLASLSPHKRPVPYATSYALPSSSPIAHSSASLLPAQLPQASLPDRRTKPQ